MQCSDTHTRAQVLCFHIFKMRYLTVFHVTFCVCVAVTPMVAMFIIGNTVFSFFLLQMLL